MINFLFKNISSQKIIKIILKLTKLILILVAGNISESTCSCITGYCESKIERFNEKMLLLLLTSIFLFTSYRFGRTRPSRFSSRCPSLGEDWSPSPVTTVSITTYCCKASEYLYMYIVIICISVKYNVSYANR